MAQVKHANFKIPAVGAGASAIDQAVNTPDDQSPRHVTGIQCSNTTKLIRVVLKKAGNPFDDIDASISGRFTSFVPCDVTYPGGLQITLDIINGSAGALAANAENVCVQYEIG